MAIKVRVILEGYGMGAGRWAAGEEQQMECSRWRAADGEQQAEGRRWRVAGSWYGAGCGYLGLSWGGLPWVKRLARSWRVVRGYPC